MSSARRKAAYFAQNASGRLTPRQRRRWAKKAVALGDWTVDDALAWLSTRQRDAGPVRAHARVRISDSAEREASGLGCGCTPELVLSDCPVHVTDEIRESLRWVDEGGHGAVRRKRPVRHREEVPDGEDGASDG